jgi:SPP1 family predicted phage head-tail adaptor
VPTSIPTWPAVNPGELVHWITLLQQTVTTDVSGATAAWAPFLSTWAKIEPVKGTDVIKSGQITTQLYLTITIRWQGGIQPNMRVTRRNYAYVIQSVENPGERDVLLILNCVGLNANE